MAYDVELADRVQAVIVAAGHVDQRRMFGGLAFFVGGHMVLCVSSRGGLMVRVAAGDLSMLLEQDHTAEMEMGGRVSRTWVRVSDDGLDDDATLAQWVARGVAAVSDLPER